MSPSPQPPARAVVAVALAAAIAVIPTPWSAPPRAFDPCATPQGYLQYCCPKPCPIIDPAALAQHVFRLDLEELKEISLFEQLQEWTKQLQALGETIDLIMSLFSSLRGGTAAAITGFKPANGVPADLNANLLNIQSLAGSLASIFFKPEETRFQQIETARQNAGLASYGYLEGFTAAIEARTKLATSAEELTKLTDAASKTTTIREDAAAMNELRLAMLQALVNSGQLLTRITATQGYASVTSQGPDTAPNANSWQRGAATPPANSPPEHDRRLAAAVSLPVVLAIWSPEATNPAATPIAATDPAPTPPDNPYGSTQRGALTAERSGFGRTRASMDDWAASQHAMRRYDRLVHMATTLHNTGAAYVEMLYAETLMQQTIDLYNGYVDATRAYAEDMTTALSLFFADPRPAVEQMAQEATVGDPFEWGDPYRQQVAGNNVSQRIAERASATPTLYGTPICRDVPKMLAAGDHETILVARFPRPPTGPVTPYVRRYLDLEGLRPCGDILYELIAGRPDLALGEDPLTFLGLRTWLYLDKRAAFHRPFALQAENVIAHIEHEAAKIRAIDYDNWAREDGTFEQKQARHDILRDIRDLPGLRSHIVKMLRKADESFEAITPDGRRAPPNAQRLDLLTDTHGRVGADAAFESYAGIEKAGGENPSCIDQSPLRDGDGNIVRDHSCLGSDTPPARRPVPTFPIDFPVRPQIEPTFPTIPGNAPFQYGR